jgi:hypothetical protein
MAMDDPKSPRREHFMPPASDGEYVDERAIIDAEQAPAAPVCCTTLLSGWWFRLLNPNRWPR